MKQAICKTCGEQIDKNDCNKRFTVIIRYGVKNSEVEKQKQKFHLCHTCTLKLDCLILKMKVRK